MIRSALIVKLSAIGDVIMALPMTASLRAANPGIRISWMCGREAAPLLEAVGVVDELIVVDERALLAGGVLSRLRALGAVWLRLAGRRFDLVVTGHADPRYRLLSATARRRRHVHFRRGGADPRPEPGRHHSDEYVRLASGRDDASAESIVPPAVSWPLSPRIRAKLPVPGAARLAAVAPGGAKNVLRDDALRRWPVESYAALAGELIASGFTVVLTGGAGDEWVRPAFAGMNVIDLVGETSLVELAALYGECRVVVTHDSGPLHIAGLAGAPLAALFGPTNPHEKAPRHRGAAVLWNGSKLACCPCYDGRTYADCRDNLCMKSISVDDVLRAVSQIAR